jgi:transposase-like protein
MVVESALEGELDDHLGYDKNDPAGRSGGNSHNGHRAKTVLTDTGPVEISVPRDRDSSFEPKMVAKPRLSGVDEMVISLSAKGLTDGEIAAHLAEVYGAEVSKQTITTITDRVMEGMTEWQSRPLDPVWKFLPIDAAIRFTAMPACKPSAMAIRSSWVRKRGETGPGSGTSIPPASRNQFDPRLVDTPTTRAAAAPL